jgi:hypothetical protein
MAGYQYNIRLVTDGVRGGRWHRDCLVLKIQVYWDVAPCHLVNIYYCFKAS